MITQADWSSLEKTETTGGGLASRRIAPESSQNLFIGVQFPSRKRSFFMEVPSSEWPSDRQLPKFRFLEIVVGQAGDETRVTLTLSQASLTDVFSALVNDVVANVARAKSVQQGVDELFSRLKRWRRLLEAGHDGGLSLQERRGLFGELKLISTLLSKSGGRGKVISSWVGPLGAHQDFHFSNEAVEVKTSATKKPQSIQITSERQLDKGDFNNLHLVHVSVGEASGGSGERLGDLVRSIEERLEAVDLDRFRALLMIVGWFPDSADRYPTPLYTVRETSAYNVQEEFPCIREKNCPSGVGDVRYSLQLGALTPFAVDFDNLIDLISKGQE